MSKLFKHTTTWNVFNCTILLFLFYIFLIWCKIYISINKIQLTNEKAYNFTANAKCQTLAEKEVASKDSNQKNVKLVSAVEERSVLKVKIHANIWWRILHCEMFKYGGKGSRKAENKKKKWHSNQAKREAY